MEFKLAEYSDYQRIAELHAVSWQAAYQGMMRQNYLDEHVLNDNTVIWQTRLLNPPFSQHCVIAEDKGQLLGFVCLFGNHSAEFGTIIDNLHISRSAQQQGLAKALLAHSLQWVQNYYPDNGIFLEVLQKNTSAVRFYESIGGVKVRAQKGDSPCGRRIDEFVYCWESPDELLDHLVVTG